MKLSSLILATSIAPLFACSSATDMVTQQAEVQGLEEGGIWLERCVCGIVGLGWGVGVYPSLLSANAGIMVY